MPLTEMSAVESTSGVVMPVVPFKIILISTP
jgi:hypothetical protein